MLAGHFGLAAIVKSREPQLPVWALMLSTQLLDVAFVILYALGIENYTTVQGTSGGYGQAIIHATYSHSLVGALVLSIVVGIVALIPWGRRNGLIIGAMVFSHWILDLIVHRMDMPILPGDTSIQVGFGLWTIPWLSAVVELALCLVGAYLYYHAAMRNAARIERQEAKAGGQPPGLRQRALTASVVMLVLLVGTLAADVLGF